MSTTFIIKTNPMHVLQTKEGSCVMYGDDDKMWFDSSFTFNWLIIASPLSSDFTTWKDVAGIAGNIFGFGLFLSPIPTFRRIIRNRSPEQFSALPYIYALLNCLICLWYGVPMVSKNNLLLTTVNSIGAAFQLVYIIVFIVYAEKSKKMKISGLLMAVFLLYAAIIIGSLQIADRAGRRITVGFLSCASLVSMFASPLFIINLVIRTKSVEFMPFCLSLSMFLMSTSFFIYGILNLDAFVYVPNGIGTILGVAQLVLYFYYKNNSAVGSREPLIEAHV